MVSALTEKILNEKPEKGIALWKAELNRNDIVDELAIAIQDMAFDLKMNSFSPEPAELTIMSAGILANSISWLEKNKPYDNKGLTGETLNLRRMNAMAQAKALEQAGRDAETPLQEYMNDVLKDMVLHSETGELNASDFKRESRQKYGVSNEVSEMLVSCFNAVCKEMDTNPNDMSKMNADYPLYRRFQNAFAKKVAKKVADNTNPDPNNKHTPAKSEKDRAAEVGTMLLARQLAVVKNWCDKILK